MLSNHLYNLVNMLVEESRSCVRLQQYIDDAGDCPECDALWEEMKADEEKHIEQLTKMVQKHMEMEA